MSKALRRISRPLVAGLAVLGALLAAPSVAVGHSNDWKVQAQARMGDRATTETMRLISLRKEPEAGWKKLATGFAYVDVKEGRGEETPKQGHVMRFHVKVCTEDGRMLSDTLAWREQVHYLLGSERFTPAFEQVLRSMKAGGRRLVHVPAARLLCKEGEQVFYWHAGVPDMEAPVYVEVSLIRFGEDELRRTTRFE